MDLVAWWWNGERSQADRRDIWLRTDDLHWTVRARHGGEGGREVRHEFSRGYEAQVMVDRLKAAAPGRWKDITRLVSKPGRRVAAHDIDDPP